MSVDVDTAGAADGATFHAPESASLAAAEVFQRRTVATLPSPWSAAFLPDGRLLVTERPAPGALLNPIAEGHIRVVTSAGAVSVPITGVPANVGVLDVVLDPDFAHNHVVYFSFLERDPSAPRIGRAAGEAGIDPAGVAVARAVLDVDAPAGPALTGAAVIWHQLPKVISFPGSGEPGGRLAFSPDGGYLYISSGDRQEFGPVQTLDDTLGKIVRLYPDGTVPTDNPFADVAGALPEIWSLGHRNPYGLVFGPDGLLWENEMGPQGGDELNVIRPGANYGWPSVSYGNNYDGSLLPKPAPGDGYAASALWWTPVIAPSGMIAYSGTAFPAWTGDLILSGLQSKGLVIVGVAGSTASEIARIDLGARTRDVIQGPDGSLWVLLDGPNGQLVQLSPVTPAAPGSSAVAPALAATPLTAGGLTLTALAGGSVVGVWNEGSAALKAQLYSTGGQKIGAEQVLHQSSAGDQGQASVVATAGGGFAVTYGERVDGIFRIVFQSFQANGVATANAVVVNTATASFHSPPTVALLGDGHYAVAWLGSTATGVSDVRVQLLAANGAKIGGEIVVADLSAAGRIGEHVVALAGGGFAVTWTDYGVEKDAYGNADTAVRGQIFDAAGTKVGAAFTVNTATAGNQDLSSIVALPTGGGFVATWRDDGYAYAGSTGTQGIWAQRFSAAGEKIGAAIQVSEPGRYGYAPTVTVVPGIGLAIAWQTEPASADAARSAVVRLLDFDGQPIGPAATIATDLKQGFPAVAAADGSIVAGWASTATMADRRCRRGIQDRGGRRRAPTPLAARRAPTSSMVAPATTRSWPGPAPTS